MGKNAAFLTSRFVLKLVSPRGKKTNPRGGFRQNPVGFLSGPVGGGGQPSGGNRYRGVPRVRVRRVISDGIAQRTGMPAHCPAPGET